MAQRSAGLRIQTPAVSSSAAASAPLSSRGGAATTLCVDVPLGRHIRQLGALAFLLRSVPLAVLLGLLYALYSLLSSARGSYFFTLSLLVLCVLSAAALHPDKLFKPVAALGALFALVVAGFHSGVFSARIFLLLTGVSGILLALGVAILAVYSGAAVSKSAQEMCFLLAIVVAPLGAVAQLLLQPPTSGSSGMQGAMDHHPPTLDAPLADDVAGSKVSSSGESSSTNLYLLGLLLSTGISLFTLSFNKRGGGSVYSSPSAAERSSQGGGYIAGRDDVPTTGGGGTSAHPASASGLETPQCVSPGQQYRQRRKL